MSALEQLTELSEPWSAGETPWLDGPIQPAMDQMAEDWQKEGLVILPELLPNDLIDAYCEAWLKDNGDRMIPPETPQEYSDAAIHVDRGRPMGWPYDTPYMHVQACRDLTAYGPLNEVMEFLIGEPMGVHLNLSGWRSTQRNWHQDGYLNPDTNADHYLAVWMALDDIHPDSGPFEYVPGSHRVFPPIRQEKMFAKMKPGARHDPNWPKYSEEILTPMFEELMDDYGMERKKFIAKKGDVLVWHARLLHRGSPPNIPGTERRSLIAHFSGINHRPDMPHPAVSYKDGWLFPIDQGGHR